MPVSMLVSSRTSTVSWGRVPADALCASVVVSEASLTVGEESGILFTACDDDGLPVVHSLPSQTDDRRFIAQLSVSDELPQLQYIGDGLYEVRVRMTLHGNGALLQVFLNGTVVAEPFHVIASCPSTGKSVALDTGRCGCQRGSYLDNDECASCPIGSSKAAAGDAACSACLPGSYAPVTGATACELCAHEEYQPLEGQRSCKRCPAHLSSAAGSASCDFCAIGHFKDLPSSPPDECIPCDSALTGASCPRPNTTTATLVVSAKHWRHSRQASRIYTCLTRSGWSPCAGDHNASQIPASQRESDDDEGAIYCAAGYRGPLCQVCEAADQHFRQEDAKCHDCSAAWENLGWLLLAVAVTAVAVATLNALTRDWAVRGKVVGIMRRAHLISRQLNLSCARPPNAEPHSACSYAKCIAWP